MNPETKTCASCTTAFTIEPEDFAFYEKIKVPPPTWCPECRLTRRMSWRNMWHLYKKADAKTGQEIFSVFPPESPVKIYEREYWASDAWDPLGYGRDIDWHRPFLAQFADLFHDVPLPAHSVQSAVNSEYCTNASYIKNCYFSRALSHTEDCAYVIWDEGSKQCMDSHMTDRCEFGYGNVNCTRCYKAFFSVNCEDCRDVLFSKDCVGCSDCVGCTGLRNKSYHIFNVPHTKEEYARKLAALDLGSRRAFEECYAEAKKLGRSFPVKFMQGLQNSDVSGDYIYNSKNAKHCWRVKEVEDSIFCHGSLSLFGCVSLRKKQYCILNKQYTKEEYEALVPKVIEHMKNMPYVDSKGREYRYGEFFPAELSPFPFNISEANELTPKTKDEVVAEGLVWREGKKRNYTATKRASELPDRIADTGEDVLKEIVACDHGGICNEECTGAFRIIARELEFLKRFNLPLPNLCPNCRHYSRLAFRNTPKFFKRSCECAGEESEKGSHKNSAKHFHGADRCPSEFETSYAPERPEIVYCEQCYQAETA